MSIAGKHASRCAFLATSDVEKEGREIPGPFFFVTGIPRGAKVAFRADRY
jgi:hypothetical protein